MNSPDNLDCIAMKRRIQEELDAKEQILGVAERNQPAQQIGLPFHSHQIAA